MSEKTRLAMVGGGAVTERCHLPATRPFDNCEVTLIVDRDLDRAQMLADKFGVPHISADYHQVPQHADAAIIALPSHLHAQASVDLLEKGVHVLVEKPMALTLAESDRMIAAAKQGGAVLAVGLMRRFLRNGRFAAWALANDLLGPLKSFDFSEGNVFNWPAHSDYFLHRELAGGGVLADNGAHTLDQLLWWLGEVDEFRYYDDAFGGVEADCELHLTMQSGVQGKVALSRTRNMRNTAVFVCERGTLEVNLRNNGMKITGPEDDLGLGGFGIDADNPTGADQPFAGLFVPQTDDFLYAVQSGQAPTVSGEVARQSVALIEAAYAQREPLVLPWMQIGELA